MKRYLLLSIFVIPMLGYSIANDISAAPYDLDEVEPVAGYTDANGLKQGYWIVYGKDAPEKGYPSEGKIEEGEFKDSKKEGTWIMYHKDGATPRLKGTFVGGRPNGPYEKYAPEGHAIETSSFNNGKQQGIYKSYNAAGVVIMEKNFNADGNEEGKKIIRHDNGVVQFEVNMVNGTPTGEATRYWEDGSVKEKIVYGADGEVISTTVVNAEPPATTTVAAGSGGPNGSSGKTKDGSDFACNGYNKLYNDSEDLWMDGTFKNCELWEGKLYKYDTDGILLKLEVWKNGKYHSDGQLKD